MANLSKYIKSATKIGQNVAIDIAKSKKANQTFTGKLGKAIGNVYNAGFKPDYMSGALQYGMIGAGIGGVKSAADGGSFFDGAFNGAIGGAAIGAGVKAFKVGAFGAKGSNSTIGDAWKRYSGQTKGIRGAKYALGSRKVITRFGEANNKFIGPRQFVGPAPQVESKIQQVQAQVAQNANTAKQVMYQPKKLNGQQLLNIKNKNIK